MWGPVRPHNPIIWWVCWRPCRQHTHQERRTEGTNSLHTTLLIVSSTCAESALAEVLDIPDELAIVAEPFVHGAGAGVGDKYMQRDAERALLTHRVFDRLD